MTNDYYQRIWQVTQAIPAGKVATYGQVADLAGLPGRARLAGKALGGVSESGYNNKPIPWYRVLRASGQIAFAQNSEAFHRQRSLLIEEGIIVKGRTVPLKIYGWQPSLEQILFELEQ